MNTKNYAIGTFPDRVELTVTGSWDDEASKLIEDGVVDRLVLNYAHGFDETSLDFLRDVPIRQLVVVDRKISDITPIYSAASSLQYLHLTTDPALTVDLGRLPRLEHLSIDWRQVRQTISATSNLKDISLRGFSDADLSSLAHLRDLRRLKLVDRPKVKSLDGIQEFFQLHEFGAPSASRLGSFSALQDCRVLEDLDLEGCRMMTSLEDLSALIALRVLNLSECGKIESIAPVSRLIKLERLLMYGTTNIVDGDLSPISELAALAEFRMQERRHYRPRVAEIMRALK